MTPEKTTRRILVIVPFAMSADNLALRQQQLAGLQFGDNLVFEYRSVKAGPANYSSHHDFALADVSIFEAGCRAQDEGFAAVCIDTMSDSGVAALRSVLDIPVFGPGKLSGIQNGGMSVRDLGEQDSKPVFRTRVEWYAGIALWHGRAAARLRGISDAAVVV